MSFRSFAGLSPALYGSAPWRLRISAAHAAMQLAMRTVLTRRGLNELDERALADLGLTREQAQKEAQRAPWELEPPRRYHGRPSPKPAEPKGMRLWWQEAIRRRRSRQAITTLGPYMLKDIGVSFAEAENEANKAFWQR